MSSFETAARSLKVELITAPVYSDVEIKTAIIAGREPGGGLVVLPDIFMFGHRAQIISVAARNNVPAVCYQSFFARDGGLLSYGVDQVDIWRRTASYVDRPRASEAAHTIEPACTSPPGSINSKTPGTHPRRRSA